jgi:molecular chaperone GrpE
MTSLDAQAKARLIEEFQDCLERCEREGDGEETGEPIDLRTLLAEMAALKNEVRLEGRQFKTLLDELRSSGEVLRAQNERLVRDLDRAREQASEAQWQAERKMLLAMLDLRDRLQAGVEAAAARPPSPFARLFPGATRVAQSLGEGAALTLRRLDELLASYRVRPLDVVGRPLDPERMRAVGVEAAPEASEGVVLRELRRGYMHGGELLRAAEVIVSKTAN